MKRFLYALIVLLWALPTWAQLPMTGAGKGAPGGGGGGCTEATTLNARFDGSQNSTAVTTLVCGLVSGGYWAGIDAFWVPMINSTGNAVLNWKSSSFTATLVSTPTFTSNSGYTTNGSTSYIDSTFNLSTNGVQYTQNSASIFACTKTAGTTGWLAGENNGNFRTGLTPGNGLFGPNAGSTITSSDATTTGMWLGSRTSSTNVDYYRNGTNVATTTTETSSAVDGTNFAMLRVFGSNFFDNGGNVWCGGVGKGFSSADAAAIWALFHAYGQTVGGIP